MVGYELGNLRDSVVGALKVEPIKANRIVLSGSNGTVLQTFESALAL